MSQLARYSSKSVYSLVQCGQKISEEERAVTEQWRCYEVTSEKRLNSRAQLITACGILIAENNDTLYTSLYGAKWYDD
jgi:hypothetical protein